MINVYTDTEINAEHPFTTLGLGNLHDVTSCIVTEEINGQYDLEMEYPIDGVYFDEIQVNRILTVVPDDNSAVQPFQIYKITRPINGVITVLAGHITYQLDRIVVTPFSSTSASDFCTKLAANIMGTSVFTFATNISKTATYTFDTAKSVKEVMEEAVDVYGGEWEYNKFACTLKSQRGANNGAIIRYGTNMTGIKAEWDTSECYTYILPYYRKGDYYRNASGRRTTAHTADYAEQRTLAVDVSEIIGDAESVTNTQLNTAGNTWLTQNGDIWSPKVSMEIEWQPLYQTVEYEDKAVTDRVQMGDTIRVIHEAMGIDVTTRVVRSDFDVIKQRFKRIEIGSTMPYLRGAINGKSGGSKR